MSRNNANNRINNAEIFEIDHAGLIYPYLKTKRSTRQFRMEVTLDREIDYELLKKTLEILKERCPTFFVKLYKSGFQYKLIKTGVSECMIINANAPLCTPFDIKNDTLIRIIFYKNTLAVEFFHCITDGTGASAFLKTLVAQYYNLIGKDIPYTNGILDCTLAPGDRELSDDFLANFNKDCEHVKRSEKRSFRYAKKSSKVNLHATCIKISIEDIKSIAKEYGLTVTEFLAALYLLALNSNKPLNNKKPVKISVPVNIRRFFDSQSLSNFSLYFNAILPEGATQIESIAQEIKQQFANGINKTRFDSMISTNVSQSEMAVFRHAPHWAKALILKIGNAATGEGVYTSTLSNVGIFDVPDELKEHILDFKLTLGETLINKIGCTVSSYNGFLNIIISSSVDVADAQNYIVSFLKNNDCVIEITKQN